MKRKKLIQKAEEVDCPVTGKTLYILDNKEKKIINSHGKCRICNTEYHASELKYCEEYSKEDWPIEYINSHCRTCIEENKTEETESPFEE